MNKFMITIVVLAGMFAASAAEAGIFGRRSCGPAVQPAPVAVAPAPATTAQAATGYRSYSYQPAAVPAATYYPPMRQATADPAFHDAGWKIRGF